MTKKALEENDLRRKKIRDKYRERVKKLRLAEIDTAASRMHMLTTRSMSGYNPLKLHSPTRIAQLGGASHSPPPPPATPGATREMSTTTEYERVQKKFSSLYEVKTPGQGLKKQAIGGDSGGRGRVESLDSLSTPRDSRTGSALQRLSLVEIVSPVNASRTSGVVQDDYR